MELKEVFELISLAQRYLELEKQCGVKKKGDQVDEKYWDWKSSKNVFEYGKNMGYNEALSDCLLWWAGRCDVKELSKMIENRLDQYDELKAAVHWDMGKVMISQNIAQALHDYLVGKE